MEIFQDTQIHQQSRGIKKIEVTRRRGQEIITMQYLIGITEYQHNMDGVDRGDQLHQHSAGFPAKAHFKKWYNRGNFWLCNFGVLDLHIAWNLSCGRMFYRGQELSRPLKEW